MIVILYKAVRTSILWFSSKNKWESFDEIIEKLFHGLSCHRYIVSYRLGIEVEIKHFERNKIRTKSCVVSSSWPIQLYNLIRSERELERFHFREMKCRSIVFTGLNYNNKSKSSIMFYKTRQTFPQCSTIMKTDRWNTKKKLCYTIPCTLCHQIDTNSFQFLWIYSVFAHFSCDFFFQPLQSNSFYFISFRINIYFCKKQEVPHPQLIEHVYMYMLPMHCHSMNGHVTRTLLTNQRKLLCGDNIYWYGYDLPELKAVFWGLEDIFVRM